MIDLNDLTVLHSTVISHQQAYSSQAHLVGTAACATHDCPLAANLAQGALCSGLQQQQGQQLVRLKGCCMCLVVSHAGQALCFFKYACSMQPKPVYIDQCCRMLSTLRLYCRLYCVAAHILFIL